MVDAIVSYAVNKLGDFVIQEANFLKEVESEVVWLQNELRWMRSFLKDAERKQDTNERIRMWISDIQDIAYDTEDVIETYLFKIEGSSHVLKRGKVSNFVNNCFCCISKEPTLYGIGKDIQALKTRVLEVSHQRERYDIENIGTSQNIVISNSDKLLHDLRITTSYGDEESDIVGFNDDTQFLEEKLFNEEPHRSIISIFGMGGLGKTTLARKLYNVNKIKFDLHAWLCVSQEWTIGDLLEKLIKSFKKLSLDELDMLRKMKDYDMELYLREILEGRQYLVVIDDVWQKEAWASLRRAFPDDKNKSRVIMTTRNQHVVAPSDQITYVHHLRFLRPDESRELFFRKAIPKNINSCSQDVRALGEEMMVKCDGLPLAIVVLGGLLSTKEFHEWNSVKDDIWRELKNDSVHVSSILALSYNDLSAEMKPCFLYLSRFPEDSIIDVEKLLHLWVAEEFIPKWNEGRDAEEIAHYYLNELVRRSLIQVVAKNWRTITSCRVHDLLRDIAVNKAKENNFLHICHETRNSTSSTMTTSRRIAFHSGFHSYMLINHSHQRVRTISNVDTRNYDVLQLLHLRFRLLRVLDLERFVLSGESLLIFFKGVGELVHLRYLGLANGYFNELPETIGKLQALQTLNLSRTDHTFLLPKGICKLKQLRHLMGPFEGTNMTLLLFADLINLQTISNIKISREGNENENNIGLEAFVKLANLRYLSVQFYQHSFSVKPLLECKKLIRLELCGEIGRIPEDIHIFLTKLQYLKLCDSVFEEDPLPALEKLPSLLVLYMQYNAARAMTWTTSAKGFPLLEILMLSRVLNVELQVDEEAMPRLRILCFKEDTIRDPVALDEAKKGVIPERWWSLQDEKSMNWKWDDDRYHY